MAQTTPLTADQQSATLGDPGSAAAAPAEATTSGKRSPQWSVPKNPITRHHVDSAGRVARTTGTALLAAARAVAIYCARLARATGRAVGSVPPALRTMAVLAALMLLGIVGSIAWRGTAGLLCSVVVIPVCAIALGALGHRRYGNGHSQADHTAQTATAAPAASEKDLQRAVDYVDHKLTLALNSFGAERQQAAMIALFQAKTALELTLGTEQTETTPIDALLLPDESAARPRIRAGAKTALRESSSLAAS
ncbi:hypothetical protein O6072_13185 [Mycolicibacterium neoaurum]|uniref:hypothetical protein n=1 Tax=Mycolicibacterium neoaurum TaxID=1795 RepID=UPI00248B4CF8|nr:hypothetical protein [Mycolicibacterium neoaurum]WBP96990.1 hypothetical protein O7W24_12885 [Mycolicibacterium neoaurum]WBS10730.1 hypothetical protein O6072_13185 [Mycolicibacterium neoaurum]